MPVSREEDYCVNKISICEIIVVGSSSLFATVHHVLDVLHVRVLELRQAFFIENVAHISPTNGAATMINFESLKGYGPNLTFSADQVTQNIKIVAPNKQKITYNGASERMACHSNLFRIGI